MVATKRPRLNQASSTLTNNMSLPATPSTDQQDSAPGISVPGKKINWGLPLKIILTTGVLYLIFRNNDWAKFGAELKNAEIFWIVLGFLSAGVGTALGALRWNRLLRVQNVCLTYPKTLAYSLIGIFFNQFLPAATGGDVIKIFYILKEAPDRKARATLSIVLDRILGLLAILLLTLVLVPLEYQRITEHAETRFFIIILALLVMVLFSGLLLVWFVPPSILPTFCHRLWEKMPKKDVLQSLYEGYQAHRKVPRVALSALAAAVLAVVPILSTGYFIAHSLHLDVHYAQMTILFSMVICSMSLPISFGGHGLREGAFILLFQIFNLTRAGIPVGIETATACSTILLGIGLVWSLIGGVVYLFYSHNLKKTP
jgi:glycosyltransferase 2 family protein